MIERDQQFEPAAEQTPTIDETSAGEASAAGSLICEQTAAVPNSFLRPTDSPSGSAAAPASRLNSVSDSAVDAGFISTTAERQLRPTTYVSPLTQKRIEQARRRSRIIEAFDQLQPALGNQRAARKAGAPYITIYRWKKSNDGTLESLMDKTHRSGRRKQVLDLNQAETEAIRANKLLNNRDRNSGGTPDAIRQTIREGGLRPETASILIEREAAGKPMVTAAVANDLHISPMITHAFRNARNAWLDHVESPGSLHMVRDAVSGQTRLWEPGEACTIDDGTKNLICTVPMQRPGDKCYEKFGVVIGRWAV